MDLIYTDAQRHDIGVMRGYSFDLALGRDENDFECVISSIDHCCENGSYIYIENTEYGGIVDEISVDTAAEKVSYKGRSWHGILQSKIIVPLLSGETSSGGVTIKTISGGTSLVDVYLVISGDANNCLAWLIDRLGLSSLFAVSGLAGVNINQYQFNRYVDGYNGILAMLKSAGLKLNMSFDAISKKTMLDAVPIINYTEDEDISSDKFSYIANRKYKTVNHLICLGTGELADRIVRHLYADEDGNISTTQTQFGADEYVAVYENTSEGEAELVSGGIERLKELWQQDSMVLSINDRTVEYGINDIVMTTDHVTGIEAIANISKKIIKITDDDLTIEYEVGE